MKNEFKKVVIFYNDEKDGTLPFSRELADLIESFGSCAELVKASAHENWTHECDLVIAVGGDGTVLHAARDLAESDIPVMGINMGRLGFLSVMDAAESKEKLRAIFAGRHRTEKRIMLETAVFNDGKKIYAAPFAFNECVVKPAQPRSIGLNADFDGKYTQSYFGDGLIVSTPTGSTAYALACFGPIVYPRLDSLLVVAISPHVLTQRPLVLPGEFTVKITWEENYNLKPPLLSIDGQVHYTVNKGDEIFIKKSQREVSLILPEDYEYFNVLNKKLKWGER